VFTHGVSGRRRGPQGPRRTQGAWAPRGMQARAGARARHGKSLQPGFWNNYVHKVYFRRVLQILRWLPPGQTSR
jgi:hypothetical protein